jgi:hypothetical protein
LPESAAADPFKRAKNFTILSSHTCNTVPIQSNSNTIFAIVFCAVAK